MTKPSAIIATIALPAVVALVVQQKTPSTCNSRNYRCRPTSSLFYTNNSSSDDLESADATSLVHQIAPPQPFTLPFLARLKTEDDWKEWQYSFSRNGLTDFLPGFSSHLSCLSIDLETGQEPANAISSAMENARLPWQRGDDADSEATTSITNVPVSTSSSSGDASQSLTCSTPLEELANRNDFDCILDSGVMNAVISSIPSKVTWHSRAAPDALLDLVKLMHEANQAIREFGIYIAITDTSIPDHAKGYLDAMGEVMGMEWNYDLDGVSNEEYYVSVARKFYTGAVNFDPSYSNSDIDGRNLLTP